MGAEFSHADVRHDESNQSLFATSRTRLKIACIYGATGIRTLEPVLVPFRSLQVLEQQQLADLRLLITGVHFKDN
jgi:hypothetical protein